MERAFTEPGDAVRLIWFNPSIGDSKGDVAKSVSEGYVEVWRWESEYGIMVMMRRPKDD